MYDKRNNIIWRDMSNKPALRDHRLKIMEGVLAWEGEIGNTRVRQLFGLQLVQASRLLAEFRTIMGDSIVEDSKARVIRPAAGKGIETDITLDAYLQSIQSATEPDPCVIDARADITEVAPQVFSVVRKAAVTGTGVIINYGSIANPVFKDRLIFPHAIVHVGRRWHVRAWCSLRNEFRDFTLGRIRAASPHNEQSPHGAADDEAWNTSVKLRLVAHSALNDEQSQVVKNEYFRGTTARSITVRGCLVQYVIQDLRAAIHPDKERPPEFQLEVWNPAELSRWLF